jgi:hypothetical protein
MQAKLKHHILTVNVSLHTPVLVQDDDGEQKVVGYYLNMGVSAGDLEEARKLVTDAIEDGVIDWSDFETHKYLPGSDEVFDKAFRKNAGVAIWYRSGRILYP